MHMGMYVLSARLVLCDRCGALISAASSCLWSAGGGVFGDSVDGLDAPDSVLGADWPR